MNSGCGVEVPATDAAGPWKAGGRIGQAVLVKLQSQKVFALLGMMACVPYGGQNCCNSDRVRGCQGGHLSQIRQTISR